MSRARNMGHFVRQDSIKRMKEPVFLEMSLPGLLGEFMDGQSTGAAVLTLLLVQGQ